MYTRLTKSKKQIASEYERYFQKLVEMLVIIGDCLPGMRVYERIFRGHLDLLYGLSEVYLDIITFCMNANKVFKKLKGKRGILITFREKQSRRQVQIWV